MEGFDDLPESPSADAGPVARARTNRRAGTMGHWFDNRRCRVCGGQALQAICAECAETLAEQGATHE